MKRVVKPSGPCMKKLAELYPTSKEVPVKRLNEAFDPLQECVALPAKKKKKAARVKPVSLEVVMVPHTHPLSLPKGKRRKQLLKSGRVKTIQVSRTMSPLQLRNSIVVGFRHLNLQSWQYLETNNGKLFVSDEQNPGGDILSRRGALYLQEKVLLILL